MSAVLMCACRSHKESDLRVAEMQQTQTAETVQKRTDSRSETQTEQTEAADSIAWTVTADSVVQTAVDGTREVLHRVRWTRTAYKPTATAKATAIAQRTDTTSAETLQSRSDRCAVQSHSESSREGQPWWLLAVTMVATIVAVILVRRKILA
jgi:hypothetical protein